MSRIGEPDDDTASATPDRQVSETPDLEGARVGLRDMLATLCDCSASWTGRNRHAPDCRWRFIHDFLDDDEIASVNAALAAARPSPAEPPAGDLRERIEALADEWEAVAAATGDRALMGDPAVAVAVSSLLESCAQKLRVAVRSTTPPEPEDGGT